MHGLLYLSHRIYLTSASTTINTHCSEQCGCSLNIGYPLDCCETMDCIHVLMLKSGHMDVPFVSGWTYCVRAYHTKLRLKVMYAEIDWLLCWVSARPNQSELQFDWLDQNGQRPHNGLECLTDKLCLIACLKYSHTW